jgi:hypothetical protein
MDRYKEGYNDCDRDWQNKIENTLKDIKEIQEEHSKSFNWSDWKDEEVYIQIVSILEDLLKRG